jgi:Cd2+/Zn2+-exporting ATPase
MAALGAVGIGAYAEGAWVLVLFSVGTTLEALALDRSRRAVAALSDLAPAQVRVIDGTGERLVALADVIPGDRMLVTPGERIAVDAIVTTGSSSVDQSPITGESVPVDVGPEDRVFAGSLNVHGALTITAQAAAAQSTLSRIAAMVAEAQCSRAPAERMIDRFARIYTPIVFATALSLAAIPPLLFGSDTGTWTYRALALLIVACPCSLVISIPVAVVSAVGGAARRGVLIKGGQALEDLATVDTVAVDKTGTLTLGLPVLADVVPLGEPDPARALALMAAIEQHSEHPLAGAILRAARTKNLTVPTATDFLAVPGHGAQATVQDRELWAGGPRMAHQQLGQDPDVLQRLHQAGQTALLLGEGDQLLAAFGLVDQVRPETAQLIDDLAAAGVGRVVMLTGDHETVARRVATDAGISEWRAGLLPEGKLDAVNQIRAGGAKVAMVGDGINDTPALAAAQVGVVMGAAGSDAALATADVALLSDRLDRLPLAITTAKRARAIMRTNVIASLIVKTACVLLAPFGLITLVVAIIADVGMSLLVTANALRLLGRTPTPLPLAPAPAVSCQDGCCP